MYDGCKITDCKAADGGGVEVNSRNRDYRYAIFGMAGGSIENCEATRNGGGVYVNIGQFIMQGGKISGNTATNDEYDYGGGGIYASGDRFLAAVRIMGGEISDNTAVSNGGGTLVNGGYALLQTEGGIFERNTANSGGGISMLFRNLNVPSPCFLRLAKFHSPYYIVHKVAHYFRCIFLHIRCHMSVSIQREAGVCMTENSRQRFSVNTACNRMGCECVSEVMETYQWQLCSFQKYLEVGICTLRIHWFFGVA